jgi:hypothetical protein
MKKIMVGQVTVDRGGIAFRRSPGLRLGAHRRLLCRRRRGVPARRPTGVSPARQCMGRRLAIPRAGRTPTGPRIPTWPRTAHWSESSQRVRKFTPCLPDDFGLRSILGHADDVSDHASPLLTRTGGTR